MHTESEYRALAPTDILITIFATVLLGTAFSAICILLNAVIA